MIDVPENIPHRKRIILGHLARLLLNTSLNIKGQAIVNDWNDAEQFMEKYNVAVF